jgi:uncharacterized damage-inducible protein DinB
MHPFYAEFLDRLSELHLGLERAIEGLPAEALDWSPLPAVNSLSVLLVHIAGAERYWIGDVVGEESSSRDRESEFQTQRLSREDLQRKLSDSLSYARELIARLVPEDMEATRVSPRDGQVYSVVWALLHALEHTALHLGHAELMRSLWDEAQTS